MTYVPPNELARVLEYDLGLEPGIKYAERISRTAETNGNTADAIAYLEAANILRSKLTALKSSAITGSFDLGTIP